ncbi:hypothetical protein [Microseira sp. BLCC-F43]|jgi:hypothetical protein|uniref:hypothetical protein n=1 Tax=Microseira sp. BLCC-F43 TaxID=3153602 RepID=UPI0035BB8561
MSILSTSQPNSKPVHRLARFVTKATAALLFNLKPEQIKRVECWRYVVYVNGEGVSQFVSYADFPPIVGVEAPTDLDFVYWRRRWKKTQNPEKRKQAPDFWAHFYANKFHNALSVGELLNWGKIVNLVKAVFAETTLHQLREVYRQEKWAIENFSIVTGLTHDEGITFVST